MEDTILGPVDMTRRVPRAPDIVIYNDSYTTSVLFAEGKFTDAFPPIVRVENSRGRSLDFIILRCTTLWRTLLGERRHLILHHGSGTSACAVAVRQVFKFNFTH